MADLLAFVYDVYCAFVTFPFVSWDRYGTWLYRFLTLVVFPSSFNSKVWFVINILKNFNMSYVIVILHIRM